MAGCQRPGVDGLASMSQVHRSYEHPTRHGTHPRPNSPWSNAQSDGKEFIIVKRERAHVLDVGGLFDDLGGRLALGIDAHDELLGATLANEVNAAASFLPRHGSVESRRFVGCLDDGEERVQGHRVENVLVTRRNIEDQVVGKRNKV